VSIGVLALAAIPIMRDEIAQARQRERDGLH
jgi:hypothetical protein